MFRVGCLHIFHKPSEQSLATSESPDRVRHSVLIALIDQAEYFSVGFMSFGHGLYVGLLLIDTGTVCWTRICKTLVI